jgi:hypothetical protein
MDPKLEAATRQLASWRPRERGKAELFLRRAGPSAIDALLAYFEHEERKYTTTTAICGLAYFLNLFRSFIEDLVARGIKQSAWYPLWQAFWLSIACVLIVAWLASTFRLRRLERAVVLLCTVEDTRAVSSLISSLDRGSRKVRAMAQAALTRLLPKLTDGDRGLLTEEHRANLIGALRPYYEAYHDKPPDLEYLRAVLHALELIGDETSAEHMEALANSPTRAETRKPVVAAAREAAQRLRARLEREKPGQVLLRAAEAADDTLLRPAFTTSSEKPEQLLRPTDSLA